MNKMSNGTKVLIVMVIVTISLFIINTVINNNKKQVLNTDKYIVIYDENIPSIYDSLGEKVINSQSEGYDKTGKYIEIKYQNITIADISTYAIALGNLDYVLTSSSTDSAVLAATSKDSGKIITISIKYTKAETTIRYSKGAGTLTKN